MSNTIFYEVEPHLVFNFSGRVQRASIFLRGIAITTSVYVCILSTRISQKHMFKL